MSWYIFAIMLLVSYYKEVQPRLMLSKDDSRVSSVDREFIRKMYGILKRDYEALKWYSNVSKQKIIIERALHWNDEISEEKVALSGSKIVLDS